MNITSQLNVLSLAPFKGRQHSGIDVSIPNAFPFDQRNGSLTRGAFLFLEFRIRAISRELLLSWRELGSVWNRTLTLIPEDAGIGWDLGWVRFGRSIYESGRCLP